MTKANFHKFEPGFKSKKEHNMVKAHFEGGSGIKGGFRTKKKRLHSREMSFLADKSFEDNGSDGRKWAEIPNAGGRGKSFAGYLKDGYKGRGRSAHKKSRHDTLANRTDFSLNRRRGNIA